MAVQDVVYDKWSKFQENFVNFGGYPENIKIIFNNCMFNNVPKRIESNSIIYDNGTKVEYQNVRAQYSDQHKIKIPFDVLQNTDTSYLGEYVATVVKTPPGGEPIIKKDDILTRFPLMLGSAICKLNGKTPEELVEMGECPSDPLAYFRVRSEKVLVIQEKLRNIQLFIFLNKDKIDCRITLPCKNGTVVSMLYLTGAQQVMRFRPGYIFKDTHIPIFGIFHLLGVDVKGALSMILPFIPEKYHEEANLILLSSIQDFLLIRKPTGKDSENSSDPTRQGQTERLLDWIHHYRAGDKLKTLNDDEIIVDIVTNLFPNVDTVDLKLTQFAHMIAQLTKYLLGIRSLDDRDSWANKRLDSAGRQLEQLFNIMWDTHLEEKAKNESHGVASYGAMNMEKDLIAAFNPGAWGAKKKGKKENYVDILKRVTFLDVLQQVTKVNTPTSRRTPTQSVRSVQPTQLGIIDPFESPEGDTIGLVKNLAYNCHISLETDPQHVTNIIEQYVGDLCFAFDERPAAYTYPILVDSVIKYWVMPERVEEMMQTLLMHRRQGDIEKDVCIFMSESYGQIEIYCNSSRPTHPVLLVNPETQELVIEEKGLYPDDLFVKKEGETEKQMLNRVFTKLVKNGCVEYLDAREQEFVILAENPRIFKLKKQERQQLLELLPTLTDRKDIDFVKQKIADIPIYTHCCVDSTDMFSIMCSLAPKANHQQGPRTSYQAGMIRQSLGMYHSVHWKRFDVGYKILLYPSRPLFEVQMARIAKLNDMPSSLNAVVSYQALPGNQEDGIIMNEDAIRKFQLIKYYTTKIIVNRNSGDVESEEIRLPEFSADRKDLYHALDVTGLPIIGKRIKDRDYILGRVRRDEYGDYKNVSVAIGYTEEGVIDRVSVEENSSKQIVKIKVRSLRSYIEGDKLAARYSQKGVCAQILKSSQMPVIVGGMNDGVVPDIIVNPHGMPSRMTLGMAFEFLCGKYAVLSGRRINGTTFSPFLGTDADDEGFVRSVQEEIQDDVSIMRNELIARGLDPDGLEVMMYPDGTIIQTPINVGICAYGALRHHVYDKFQCRGSDGPVHVQTHQPVSGRSKLGGLRVGEMEKDALLSHGASGSLRECLCVAADIHKFAYCTICGIPPTYKMSIGSAPPAYQCRRCQNNDFSIIEMSYTFKFLCQTLASMGIEISLDLEKISDQHKHLI